MSIVIFQNEASANSRTVPMRIFLSDGTSPDTTASNDSLIQVTPSAATFTPNAKLAAVHAAQGMYAIVLNQSDVSLTGINALYHTQGDFPQHVANINVVAYNPNDGARLALSNITVPPGTYSGVTFGINNIAAGTYSGVTVGINNVAAGTYSGVTIGGSSFVTINPGTYSNVTFSAGGTAPSLVTLAPGTHSSVTIAGVTRVNSSVTIADATYSAVTIGGVTRVNSNVTVAAADYTSSVTVGVGGFNTGVITTASIAAAALDATVFSTGAEQAFADRFLLRAIDGGADSGRSVGQALYALRNKVDASGSVGTVYQTDDTTSAYTFSTTTAAFPISSVDPA